MDGARGEQPGLVSNALVRKCLVVLLSDDAGSVCTFSLRVSL